MADSEKKEPRLAVDTHSVEPECGKTVSCPRNYDPVCGTDGKTYANECMLCVQKKQMSRLRIAKRGMATFRH